MKIVFIKPSSHRIVVNNKREGVFMAFILLFISITTCMTMTLKTLFSPYRIKGKMLSLENFLVLVVVYMTITLGFALIFLLFDMQGYPIVRDGLLNEGDGFLMKLESSFYFSAMTLFSVGYGDIYPLGIGRMIAVFEALIGYTIPAAFVAKTVLYR
jgi:potassium channel LctB